MRILILAIGLAAAEPATAQIAVRGRLVHTMTGEPLRDAVVIIENGRITAVGPAATTTVPAGTPMMVAEVVTPGLIDARATAGLTGFLNQKQDQDQLDPTDAIQPELRAIDAFNPDDPLVAWVRGFGVTTLHTGHAPGALVSGQTLVVKTAGRSLQQDVLVPAAAVAANLGPASFGKDRKSPGTRGKQVAMLRQELLKAREYAERMASSDPEKRPDRNLRLETLSDVLAGRLPLLVTAHRAQDIRSALRLRDEFGFRLLLDGAAEAYLLLPEIRAAGVPVLVHPAMQRATDDLVNMSFTTAAALRKAEIAIALQSGFESYVPKTRVVLFEAAVAAAHDLGPEAALAAITRDAAHILGVADRVGSIAPGRDGDLALFDGDPFEYTTHCMATIIEGTVVSTGRR